jgi:hypothetical protein
MYKRYISILDFLPEDLKPACEAWYACRILRGMTREGTPYKDISDYFCGLNLNTAWGEFTMTKMVFWELRITVKVKKEETILFFSRIFTHNAVDIQGGIRHVLDTFIHQNMLLWKDNKHRELTSYRRKGLPEKKRKINKDKGKKLQTAGEAASEAPIEPKDWGGEDIEWEKEFLYPMEAQEVAGDKEAD